MAKMNVDSAKLKEFFVAHGEKFGLFVGLLLFGLLTYSGLQVQGYDKKPEDLAAATRAAEDNLANSHKPPRLDLAKDGVALPEKPFATIIKDLLIQKIEAYKYGGIEWNKPLFDTKQRRSEPTYLALRDLRASFHYGAVHVKDASGNRVVQGREWVCVTGVVPFQDQTAAYRRAFENALDRDTNAVPIYGVYQIQRAEVNSADPNAAINWDGAETLNLAERIVNVMNTWDGNAPEIADPAYVKRPLTQPLPPVPDAAVLGEWCVHLPEVPLAPVRVEGERAPAAPMPAAPAAGAAADFLGGAAPAAAAPGAAAPAAAAPMPAAADAAQQTPFYLFRFLDFDVKPTKSYRYRVKLVLNNPNKGLDPAHLEKPDLAIGDFREAPYSEASTLVSVPVLGGYLAHETEAVNGDNEPTTGAAVRTWLPSFGAVAYSFFPQRFRGTLLDQPDADVTYRIPGDVKSKTDKFPLQTGAMLADFSWERGDARQKTPDGRPLGRPSEILFRAPSGELVIHTQLMDWPQWSEFKQLVENPAGGGDGGGAPAPARPNLFGPAAGGAAAPAPAPAGAPTLRLK